MNHVWIIGSGGLLGSALGQALHAPGVALFVPPRPLAWSDERRLLAQLDAAVAAFASTIAPEDTWEIYWAAGVGTLASPASELVRETAALDAFLRMLERDPVLRGHPGAFGFASSAGAIYAGAFDRVINEDTPVAPTTPYAHAKLAQEALVRGFAERQDNVHALTARISTLYGAGQSLGKKQGLLTHIARSIVRNKPIQIYVPFDTIRDYITAADAAARMIIMLRQRQHAARHLTQVVASEHPTTIAEILATFKRVSRRTPLVVTSVHQNASLYTRRVQYRSIASSEPHEWPSTTLIVGVGQLLQAERFQFARPKYS